MKYTLEETMERERLADIAERLRVEIMPPLALELHRKTEELKDKDIDAFHEVITPLLGHAKALFRELIEIPPTMRIPDELLQIFYGHAMLSMNSALKSDFPYAVAMVNIVDEQRYTQACVTRQLIESRHPDFAIKPKAVPVLWFQNAEDMSNANIMASSLVFYPDNLVIKNQDDQSA